MTSLSLTDETPPRLALRCSPRYRDRAQEVPGLRFDRKLDAWCAPLSLAVARVCRGVFPDLDVDPAVYDAVTPEADRNDKVRRLKDGSADPSSYQGNGDLALFPYQAVAAESMIEQQGFINQDDKGNGKTPMTLATLEAEQAWPALIVATNSMKHEWAKEALLWTSATPYVLEGTPAARALQLRTIEENVAAGVPVLVVIGYAQASKHSRLASYGSVARTVEEKQDKELNAVPWKSVVVDECVPDTTLVETLTGPLPICDVAVGDLVLGVDHTTGDVVWSKVLRTMTSPDRPLVKVGPLHITPEHPVWSFPDTLCYASMYAIDYEDRQDMRVVRNPVPDHKEGRSILREVMQFQAHAQGPGHEGSVTPAYDPTATATGRAGEVAGAPTRPEQPGEVAGEQGQGTGGTQGAGVSGPDWWQWNGGYRPAADFAAGDAGGMVVRGFYPDQDAPKFRVSDNVQGGSCVPRGQGGGGGTRSESFVSVTEAAGPEEAGVSSVNRMDDSRGVEQGRNGRPLWNLETATGNYVANGVLVHNCHRIKDPKAKQTRAIFALGQTPSCVYRYALTATPIANHTIDLWGPLHFARPADFPSRSKFRDRYVLIYQNHWGGVEDMGLNPATEEEFRAIYDPISIRRPLQVEAKMLPPQYRFLDMEPKQRAAYNKFEKDGILKTDNGEVLVATNPLVLNTRLQQLAAATPVVDDEGNVTALAMPSAKVSALIDLVEEMAGAPLVAFSESKKLIRLAYDEITKDRGQVLPPDRVAVITGDVPPADRTEIVARFQRGEIDLLLCTIGAGSEGITLTRASTMVFLTRSYRMLANNQAEGRLLRIGQDDDVQVIDFVTRNTVEARVHEATQGKEELLQQLVQDPGWVRRFLPRG